MKDPSSDSAETLRRRAEVLAQAETPALPENLDAMPPGKVLHTLPVRQSDPDALNEELIRSRAELEASQARYFDLFDLAPVGYFTLSEQGIILEANLAAAVLLGESQGALVNQPLFRFILTVDQDVYYTHRGQLAATGIPQDFELRLNKKGANPFWSKLHVNLSTDSVGVNTFRVVVSDISNLKANEKHLRLAVALFENAREGFMVTDAYQRILIVNHAFIGLTGYSTDDVLGRTPRMLKSGRQDQAFYAEMWSTVMATGHWQGEVWNRRKNGETYPQLLSISAVRDEHNQISHYVGVFSDISQLKDAAAKLEFMAHHDSLTGLPNRLLLYAGLQHCIDVSQRERKCFSILMLDLDRFKSVNDSFGHLMGDELLQQVAGRLISRLRSIDTVTRLGGDEFAVLLDDLQHPQDAALVASEIIDAISQPFGLSNGAEVRIGVSIGISLFPEHGQGPEELLRHADSALYRAKAEGRGNFRYFCDDMTHSAQRRINLESLLRRAVTSQGLRIHYQPQIDIASGRIVGAEALVRLHDTLEGLILPSQFIPVAEQSGQIAAIGEWVLRETCRQGQEWIKAGLPALNLAVNISPYQFRHGDIIATVAAALAESGFPADRLELEMTESTLMEKDAVLTLNRLRALGVLLAIDDFGTGYSSLAYLKHFPLDALKIDKSFIDDIAQLQDDREIAAAIVALGHILRLRVLAEGVETTEQLDFIREQGCDLYQGYLNSPPVTAEAFAALLRRQG